MRLGPPPEVRRDPRPVLDRLHPRHGAGLPQADHRAARRVHRPDLAALIDGAKYVHPRLTEIIDELGARRHRRGQRRRVPGARGVGPAVGPDRVVQSRRDQGCRRPAVLVGLPGRRPGRLAGLPGRGRADPPRHVGGLRRVLPRARRPGLSYGPSAPTSSPNRRGSTCTATRPRPTTSASARWARPGIGWTRRSAPPRRPGSCPNTSANGTAP